MNVLKWKETVLRRDKVNESTIVTANNGRTYQVKATYFTHTKGYRVDLLEDRLIVDSLNTSTEAFKKAVKPSIHRIDDRMIVWAQIILREHIKRCEVCREEKVLLQLKDHDQKYEELDGLEEICFSCRCSIYNSIGQTSA